VAGFPSSFVGLVVADTAWRSAVTSTLPSRARALHADDLHLTLAFFGGVAPERAAQGFAATSRHRLPRITVRLGRVVPMGPEGRWTALSALIEEGRETVAAAMLAVRDEATDAAGVARETRPPVPHLTIARLHAKASATERAAAVSWASSLALDVALELREVALYTGRIVRPPGEPAYRIVASRPLGDPPA
jgi:RNA 2',3'-cyclic 3'-phosphodiesterase